MREKSCFIEVVKPYAYQFSRRGQIYLKCLFFDKSVFFCKCVYDQSSTSHFVLRSDMTENPPAKSLEHTDMNPGLLYQKRKVYLYAMPPLP